MKGAFKTNSQNKPIYYFVLYLDWGYKGKGVLGMEVPRKGTVNPTESSGAVGAKCPEFGVQRAVSYFHELHKDRFSFSLRPDDYAEMITQHHH